jgi:hypothetical protein
VEENLRGEWKPRKDRASCFWQREWDVTDSSVEQGLEVGRPDGSVLNGLSGNRQVQEEGWSIAFSVSLVVSRKAGPNSQESTLEWAPALAAAIRCRRSVKFASHTGVVSGSRMRLGRVVASAVAMFGSVPCGGRVSSGKLGRNRRFAGGEVTLSRMVGTC